MSILFNRLTKNACNIVINRPAKRNALNLPMICDLKSRLREFEEDPSLTIAILSGSGGNFCSGYDLNEIVNIDNGMPRLEQIEKMLWPLDTQLSKKKITIAAIDGHAAGFGYELALKCDFRLAERDVRMGFLNRRFGIPIMNGGTVILPKLIGMARAMDLVATGKAQLAPEALQYGLLINYCDIGCVVGRSLNFGRSLVKFDQIPLLSDLKSMVANDLEKDIELMRQERRRSLEYLQQCGPLTKAVKFLKGELCRHGNFDLGNLVSTTPEVTL